MQRRIIVQIGFAQNAVKPLGFDDINAVFHGNFKAVVLFLFEHRHRYFFAFIAFDRRERCKLSRHGVDQLLCAVANRGDDFIVFQAFFLHIGTEPLKLFVACQIHFIAGDNLGALRKLGVEFHKLFVDFFKIFNRVAPLAARDVHHVHQHPAALDMAQKCVPETYAVRSALDKPGNIRHHKALPRPHGNHAQNRRNRCEMIIADNGFCFAHNGNQRRFPDIREAQKSDVGNQLEFERNLPLLAGRTAFRKTRGLARGGCKMPVAPAAFAAFCGDKRLVRGHIRHHNTAFTLADNRAARHTNHKVLPFFAVAARTAAVLPVFGFVFAFIAEIRKGRKIVVHLKHDVAAAPTVAAVRSAGRDIFFTVERNRAVAAVARFNLNFCNIYKHSLSLLNENLYTIIYLQTECILL